MPPEPDMRCTECGMPLEERDFYLDGRPVCRVCYRDGWAEPEAEPEAMYYCPRCGRADMPESLYTGECLNCSYFTPAQPAQLSPLAPRPFSQSARRFYRLGLDIPLGFLHAVSAVPWLRVQRRRRAAVALSRERLRMVNNRRVNRVYVKLGVLLWLPYAYEEVA
jgi:hypothetical protein